MGYYTQEQLDKMRAALKHAKENPQEQKSQEIFKRIRGGQMNFELKALGLEPVKIKQPKVDMAAALQAGGGRVIQAEDEAATRTDVQRVDGTLVETNKAPMSRMPRPEDESRFSRALKDIPSDLQETSEAMRQVGTKMGREIYDVATDDDFTLGQKFMGVLGSTAKGVASGVGEATMGLGKTFMTPQAEERLGQLVRQAGESLSETEIAQRVVPAVTDWYSSLDKDEKLFVDSAGGMAMVIAEMFGVSKAKKPLQAVGEGIRQSGEFVAENAPRAGQAIQEGAESVARTAGGVVDTAMASQRAARVAEQESKATEAVGRILQAGDDQRAIESAKRALSELDTSGVQTYDDLNNAINDQIKGFSRAVDAELDKVPGNFTKENLVKTIKVGDEVVTENPVEQAIQGLIEAYNKSGETAEAVRIRQLNDKLNNEGLTLREVNELAREYGIEYRDRAFTKLGDPKTGYNAESYENIRKGVKDVLREKMPNDATKELDSKISDLFATRSLTTKIEDKVAKLEQRITNRTFAQKVGGGAAEVLDLVTAGALRGFVAKVLPSNVGNKAMNSLDIQNELRKNLAELDRLSKMKDDKKFADAFEEYMKNMQPGMSIRSTVTPLSVGEKLTEADFDLMVDGIENLADARLNPDFNEMLTRYGLQNAEDAELERFMKEATDQFERPETSFNQSATTKTTDLLEEARKYDSAEEFINAQKENFAFHGTPFAEDIAKSEIRPSKSGNLGEGLYLSRDKNTAREFTKLQGGGKGSNYEDSGNGLYTEVSTGEQIQTTPGVFPYYIGDLNLKKLPEGVEQSPDFAKQAMKEGYDGVDASNSVQEPQVVVFPDSIKKMRGLQDMKKVWEQSR